MLMSSFFANQEIFITGGSGFIGKVLIEKLLRSCPEVGKIHVLLRGKKGKSIEERLKVILDLPLFKYLRDEQPHLLQKINAISGDCMEVGLGIKPEDLAQLQNVNIIFHSAASVRFDDDLRDAILMNVRGTHELVKIAETLKHLKVFMHVSTTYCNPHEHIVEEKVYPCYVDWRSTIKLAETYDTETLNVLNLKYSNFQPNTYTFTKGIAEQIIKEYSKKLPAVIFRPSIVISAIDEPVPGWVDNFNGPIGMLVACGIGIMRTNYADPDIVADYVPVDVVVRGMLIAAYQRGLNATNKDDLIVYNCATANLCPITVGEVIEIGKRRIRDNPFEKTLWVPGGSITRCYFWNLIRFVTLHVFMAILVDTFLWASNSKPFLLKLQRRIYAANLALHYFLVTSWIFRNDNFYALNALVPQEEFKKFEFLQYQDLNYDEFFSRGISGAKHYLLKEPLESSRQARLRLKILLILHHTIRILVPVLAAQFVVRFIYHKFFT